MPSKQNLLPLAGVLSGALVWGLIWYPFRVLLDAGIPGTLTTLFSYLLAILFGSFMLPRVWRELRMHNGSISWAVALVMSAGWANFGYVLAVLHGEVMRILLLFYLAPLWTILFSYWMLGERLNCYGYIIIALSLSGAFIMLWNPQIGRPLPNNPSEWIGLSAGMAFALSNVLSRRAAHLSIEAKSCSVWLGSVLLSAPLLLLQGGLQKLPLIDAHAWLILVLLGIVLCAISYAVQFGIAHMAANRAIILFLFELVVAAISSYILAGEIMYLRDWIGALLIISASMLSGKMHAK